MENPAQAEGKIPVAKVKCTTLRSTQTERKRRGFLHRFEELCGCICSITDQTKAKARAIFAPMAPGAIKKRRRFEAKRRRFCSVWRMQREARAMRTRTRIY